MAEAHKKLFPSVEDNHVAQQPPPGVIIRNRDALLLSGNRVMRGGLLNVLEAGIRGGNPGEGTRRKVRVQGRRLIVEETVYDLDAIANIYVVGAGKGSYPIAEALDEILGDRIAGGVVVVKRGEHRRLKRIDVHEAAHPVPDQASLTGALKIQAWSQRAEAKDLVFAAITGGSSSLVTLPPDDISLEEIQHLNELLLRSGAVIQEMNIVRRHLCALKGGRLVSMIQPAQAVTLTLDTAPDGMPWPDMSLPDPTTFQDAIRVLEYYDLWEKISNSVRDYLIQGTTRPEFETVKSLEGMRAQMVSVGDPVSMCESAAVAAEQLGYPPLILATHLEGEAREVGICLAGIAKEIVKFGRPARRPCALISGGETTVTIRGSCGLGGPNQEFVLSLAYKLRIDSPFVCASIDSDGTDGPTDAAGGIVDNETVHEAQRLGVDIPAALKRHDTLVALEKLNAVIMTGHTGTNLQNLRVMLIG
jgi:glycerate 2-kinase